MEGALVGLGGTILLAGLAVAWRLGGLERRVKDLGEDVGELQRGAQEVRDEVSRLRGALGVRGRSRGGW